MNRKWNRSILFPLAFAVISFVCLAGVVSLWFASRETMYMVAYMRMETPGGGTAYQLGVVTGRFHFAIADYADSPFNEGFSFFKVPQHQMYFRYPVDHDPLTGSGILMGFEYQRLTVPSARVYYVPCYLPAFLFLVLTVAGWLRYLSRVRCMRGVAKGLCVRCGYDLQGCPSDRCPECGTEHELPIS